MLGVGLLTVFAAVSGWRVASRWRLAGIAEERRRIQRDVHDGAQQRLFAASILMDVAKQELGDATAASSVARAQVQLADAIRALRELTAGVSPRPLVSEGLATALTELCDRSPVPVVLDVERSRCPLLLEETAYFLVAEALTNVYRHAQASKICVTVWCSGGFLFVTVADDGVGGVLGRLCGLEERVAVVGGSLLVDSPAGLGTTVRATLPVPR